MGRTFRNRKACMLKDVMNQRSFPLVNSNQMDRGEAHANKMRDLVVPVTWNQIATVESSGLQKGVLSQ